MTQQQAAVQKKVEVVSCIAQQHMQRPRGSITFCADSSHCHRMLSARQLANAEETTATIKLHGRTQHT